MRTAERYRRRSAGNLSLSLRVRPLGRAGCLSTLWLAQQVALLGWRLRTVVLQVLWAIPGSLSHQQQ